VNRPIHVELRADEDSHAQALAAAARVLLRGELALLPAEGLYGLHAAALAGAALERLAALKQAPPGRGYILLVGTPEQAGVFAGRLPGAGAELIGRAWPGPLTLLLPATAAVPPALQRGGIVALRCPGSRLLRELALSLPSPLVSTSANLAGAPPPAAIERVDARIRDGCQVVVDAGELPGGASTVVRPEEDGSVTLLRPGLWKPDPDLDVRGAPAAS
jgi:L-threonylcarbamoyladenylate synthase